MEKNEKRSRIGETAYEYDSGSWVPYYIEGKEDKNGNTFVESTALANHVPLLLSQRMLDDGVETFEELVYRVHMAHRPPWDVSLTPKDILSQTPTVKMGAACRIFIGRGTKSRYSEFLQIQCETVPITRIYQHTGYVVIDGKRFYLNGGYSVSADGLTDKCNVVLPGQLENYCFTNEKDSERYKTLLTALPAVAPSPLIYAGLGLSFLTPLNALLRDCGIEPDFTMYFIGKTGTRKTTMAKLFLNFFGRYDNGTASPASFRDTANSIEKKFALIDSALVLLDDRIPSTTPKIKAQMEGIEQDVARMIGDRSGRGRMNADGSLRPVYRPKCNLIVTAEEAYSNVGESGIARSVSVELKPSDIDLAALTVVQRHAEHLNQCMSEYIQFVIQNWDSITEQAKPLFLKYRTKAQNGGHGRLAEGVAHLQIGIHFMCQWLLSIKIIDESQAKHMEEIAWDVFFNLAEKQNSRITEETPVNLFLNAVRAMLDRGSINVVEIGKDSDYSSPSKVGYRDENYYYFDPQGIYVKVKEFYALQDRTFPLSQSALYGHLANDKLIEVDVAKNGRVQTTKAKRIKGVADGRQVRYLWLRISALYDEREDNRDGKS